MSRSSIARSTFEREGSARARRIRADLAGDIRVAREDAGLSLRALASAAGVGKSTLHAIERGAHDPTTEVVARIGSALGMSLSVRLYPGSGPLIRDHVQTAMLQASIDALSGRWRATPEVGITRPVRGVIDLVLEDSLEGAIVACEAHSDLRRVEQQVRWARTKADGLSSKLGRPVVRLLLLRHSLRTRTIVSTYRDVFAAAYPARSADAFAALTGDRPWPGDALLWCRVEGTTATIMPGAPRGIEVGR